jgi:hypothetical protein
VNCGILGIPRTDPEGTAFRTVDTSLAYAFVGIVRGEWERHSTQNTTNMDQVFLQWRDQNNPNGPWYNWAGVLCWGDTLPSYKWNPYAANAWDIVTGSGC